METINTRDPEASLEMLRQRRVDVFALARGDDSSSTVGTPAYCGLALSGGGIRSATFSLGVIQAIALTSAARGAPATPPPRSYAASLLSCVDYLSTVSGGGYVGSFLASLFLPGRLSQPASPSSAGDDVLAAESALRVLQDDPPGRIRTGTPIPSASPQSFPLAWLRDSGRYLTPTGAGDLAYDMSLALRNWVAVHFVIGTVFVLAFAALALLRYPLWVAVAKFHIPAIPSPANLGDVQFEIWWGPAVYLPAAFFVLLAAPAGLAYWWCGMPTKLFGTSRASWGALLIAFGLWMLGLNDPIPIRAKMSHHFACLLALSVFFYGFSLATTPIAGVGRVVAQRVQLTRWLRNSLTLTVSLAVLASLEAIGQSIYLYETRGGNLISLFSSLGTAGLLTLLVKRGASFAAAPSSKGWTSKFPLTTLAGVAGLVIIYCIAVVWSFVFYCLLWGGNPPELTHQQGISAACWTVSVAVLLLAILTGLFPGFINLSSLQTLYGARLTRAYLGASNGLRQRAPPSASSRSAAEPVAGDDVKLEDYVGHKTQLPTSFAPLHLINVTLNETVDPAEQLVQRDRKGLPMAVSPVGYWIDGTHYSFAAKASSDINGTPSVGKWAATSGAAVSTGLGRRTSLGLSLLLGAANVRLGTWWNCPGASIKSPATSWYATLSRGLFRTQSYLMDEFRAKFYGLRRDWQYLSDGGHFENTGIYEMLRKQRRVGFVFATDAGADRDYDFEDLAILIRLVRIDFGIELEVDTHAATDSSLGLNNVFGTPQEFHDWSTERRLRAQSLGLPALAPASPFSKCAVLLKAYFPGQAPHCWIVLFKPSIPNAAGAVSADVIQYTLANPTFPQQTTADQFFDEAQWESYRKLGITNARAVLAKLDALRSYTGTRCV